jgi:hypothetical protein
MPTQNGVGAAEPFRHAAVFKVWRWAMLALVVAFSVKCTFASGRLVLDQVISLPPRTMANEATGFTVTDRLAARPVESFPAPEPGQPTVVITEPFELAGGKNVMVEANANVDNAWIFAAAEMLNEESGDLQPFSLEVGYYHGVDGGESWSEGGNVSDTRVSAMPEGPTRIRLEIERDPGDMKPVEFTLRVTEDAPNPLYLFITMLLLSLFPLVTWALKSGHERRRWENSDFPKHQEDE